MEFVKTRVYKKKMKIDKSSHHSEDSEDSEDFEDFEDLIEDVDDYKKVKELKDSNDSNDSEDSNDSNDSLKVKELKTAGRAARKARAKARAIAIMAEKEAEEAEEADFFDFNKRNKDEDFFIFNEVPLELYKKCTMDEVKNAILKSNGIKSIACKILKCSGSTLNGYLNNNEFLRILFDEQINKLGDIAESKLISHVKKGEPWAIRFVLTTKFKDRGYTRDSIVKVDFNETTNINMTKVDVSVLSREEVNLARKLVGDKILGIEHFEEDSFESKVDEPQCKDSLIN